MKKLIIILTLFTIFLNCAIAANTKTVTKDYKIVTKDGFSMTAKLEYPKVKNKTEYSTIVFLHSLGYTSDWWETLPNDLLKDGYAVLLVDLRGHGNSVYNAKLQKVSWKSLTKNAYAKYPDDIISVIDYIKTENKRTFFNNWAIVGSDIGALTAIHVANKIEYKPKTIVMLSPIVQTKGLYAPVKLAELNNIDILSIVGDADLTGIEASKYLKKFAQSTFAEYTAESRSNGMLLLKHDTSLSKVITSWIAQYLK